MLTALCKDALLIEWCAKGTDPGDHLDGLFQ